MILRRYGSAYHSVEPDFNPKAMNEVGFRRNGAHSIPADEFEAGYERKDAHQIEARTEGDVQIEVETELLDLLRADVEALASGLPDGSYLVVENETGKDWPRLRSDQRTTVVGTENRLYFRWHIDPPIKVAVYTPRS